MKKINYYEELKDLNKPFVIIQINFSEFEGNVICLDEDFIEIYNSENNSRKFIKINSIDDLKIVQRKKVM